MTDKDIIAELRERLKESDGLLDRRAAGNRDKLMDNVDELKDAFQTLQGTVNLMSAKQTAIIEGRGDIQKESDFKLKVVEEKINNKLDNLENKIDSNTLLIDKLNTSIQAQFTKYTTFSDITILLNQHTVDRHKDLDAWKNGLIKKFQIWGSIFVLGGASIMYLYNFVQFVNKPQKSTPTISHTHKGKVK